MRSASRRTVNYSEAIQVGLDDRRRDALLAQIDLRNEYVADEPRVSAATARFAAVLMLADRNDSLSGPAALAEAETLVLGNAGKVMERMVAAMLDLGSLSPRVILKQSECTTIARVLTHIAVEAARLSESLTCVGGGGR